MAASPRQRASLASALLGALLLFLLVSAGCSERVEVPGAVPAAASVRGRAKIRATAASLVPRHRKVLQGEHLGEAEGGGGGSAEGLDEETNRMGQGECSKDDIVVYQAASSPLPSGIPTYSVQVINTCLGTGCGGPGGGISRVHLSCGWFSSARTINPRIFRRLRFDDCLVNDGRAIPAGDAVSFEYANTYPYSLAVASVSCLPTRSP